MKLSDDTDDIITEDILKKKYRKLSFQLHPDYNKSQDATEQFQKLSNFYEFLRKLVPFSIKIDHTQKMKDDMSDLFAFMKRRMDEEDARKRRDAQKFRQDAQQFRQNAQQQYNRQQYKQQTKANNGWRQSSRGNWYVVRNNLTYIVYAKSGKWKYCIKDSMTGDTKWRDDIFDTVEAAKSFVQSTHLQMQK